jgi:glycosyltransferase involved in cell wall biosynthesis
MQQRVAKKLDHIVTVSGVSRRDIVADFGVDPRRVAVMYNGVDVDLFTPRPDQARKPNQIMATASADTPTKGLHILLPAVADLIAAGRDINVVLIGKPRQGGDTEQLTRRLGLEPHIRWYHDLEQERIVDLYAESTLAVVPSLYEGFGLPAVEAMACGIPLVCSDGGALAEVVGDAARVVPAGNISALTAALADLLDNVAAREELGQRGRSRAQSEFSWQVCAQRLTAYYQSVISLGAHTADRLETGA